MTESITLFPALAESSHTMEYLALLREVTPTGKNRIPSMAHPRC